MAQLPPCQSSSAPTKAWGLKAPLPSSVYSRSLLRSSGLPPSPSPPAAGSLLLLLLLPRAFFLAEAVQEEDEVEAVAEGGGAGWAQAAFFAEAEGVKDGAKDGREADAFRALHGTLDRREEADGGAGTGDDDEEEEGSAFFPSPPPPPHPFRALLLLVPLLADLSRDLAGVARRPDRSDDAALDFLVAEEGGERRRSRPGRSRPSHRRSNSRWRCRRNPRERADPWGRTAGREGKGGRR